MQLQFVRVDNNRRCDFDDSKIRFSKPIFRFTRIVFNSVADFFASFFHGVERTFNSIIGV